MNWQQAEELVANYDDVYDLIKIIQACERKIGGVALIVTPDDVRNQVDNIVDADEIDLDEAGKQQLVDSVTSSFEWITGIRNVMEEEAWGIISSTIDDRLTNPELLSR